MDLELCFGRYASVVFAMNEYKSRHEALYELIPRPISNKDMTFTHQLSPAETDRIKPYTLMLESLLDSMIALLAENMDILSQCLKQYEADMTRYFGKSLMTFEADPSLVPTP